MFKSLCTISLCNYYLCLIRGNFRFYKTVKQVERKRERRIRALLKIDLVSYLTCIGKFGLIYGNATLIFRSFSHCICILLKTFSIKTFLLKTFPLMVKKWLKTRKQETTRKILVLSLVHLSTHTHTHIYIYIYICVCVCVCVFVCVCICESTGYCWFEFRVVFFFLLKIMKENIYLLPLL